MCSIPKVLILTTIIKSRALCSTCQVHFPKEEHKSNKSEGGILFLNQNKKLTFLYRSEIKTKYMLGSVVVPLLPEHSRKGRYDQRGLELLHEDRSGTRGSHGKKVLDPGVK